MEDIRTGITALLSSFAIAVGCGACTFDPAKGEPFNLVLGAPCTDDRDCASRVCSSAGSAIGECLECRETTPCPSGRSCDSVAGRCVPVQVRLGHAPSIGGERRTNAEGRVHVGRVAVVPVTTVVESAR